MAKATSMRAARKVKVLVRKPAMHKTSTCMKQARARKTVCRKKPAGINQTCGRMTPIRKKPAGVKRTSIVQQVRHRYIVEYIKEELAEWVAALAGDDARREGAEPVITCPICARTSDRRRNMNRHAATHTSGKLAAMFESLESGGRCPHPVYMEIVRAIFEADAVKGDMQGQYCARTQELLTKWARFKGTASDTGSVFTVMGPRDGNMTLVLTSTGPEYWLNTDGRLRGCKMFGPKQHFTKDFANMFMRGLMREGGVYARALRTVRTAWQSSGCEVTQLACRRSQTMAGLACSLMESSALSDLSERCTGKFRRHGEYKSVSVDATYKLALKVTGQTRTERHTWTSIVGARGSPMGLVETYGESPAEVVRAMMKAIPEEARDQVEHVAVDACSKELWMQLSDVLPNLRAISLDPLHVCFMADSHSKDQRVRPTLVGLVLRSIMGKFSIPDPARRAEPFYEGGVLDDRDRYRRQLYRQIEMGSVSKRAASKTLRDMNPNEPMESLTQFMELIAALVAMYPEKMDLRHDKTTMRKSLLATCSPSRFEWLLNGLRYRSRIPAREEKWLAVGTTRNEQMHHVLNAHFRTIVCVSKRTMAAELRTWLCTEQLVFTRAFESKATRKVSRADMVALVSASTTLFTNRVWQTYLTKPQEKWIGNTNTQKRKRRPRRGPTTEQADVYNAIRRNTVKRARGNVYQSTASIK